MTYNARDISVPSLRVFSVLPDLDFDGSEASVFIRGAEYSAMVNSALRLTPFKSHNGKYGMKFLLESSFINLLSSYIILDLYNIN